MNNNSDFWLHEKIKRADESIDSVCKVWSIFTDDLYQPQGILDFALQCPETTLQNHADLETTENTIYGLNAYSINFPKEVSEAFDQNNPITIFDFLFKFARHNGLQDPALLDLWSMDLATVTASLWAKMYSSFEPRLTKYLSSARLTTHFVASRLFWDIPGQQIEHYTKLSTITEQLNFVLKRAHDSYRRQFSRVGVDETELFNLAHLWHFNENTILDGMGITRDGRIIRSNDKFRAVSK